MTIRYVHPQGSDVAAGTNWTTAYASWDKAFSVAVAGDTINIAPGVYQPVATRDYGAKTVASGTGGSPITVQGVVSAQSRPVLDCRGITPIANDFSCYGIDCRHTNWIFNDLDVMGVRARDDQADANGFNLVNATNVQLNRCRAYRNQNVGVQFSGATTGTGNSVTDCDGFYNYDPLGSPPGGNADGFQAVGLPATAAISFTRCRSWGNSDDCYDLFNTLCPVTFDNCIAGLSGYFPGGRGMGRGRRGQGDGNGYKLGANSGSTAQHVLRRCLAFGCPASGFDDNVSNAILTFLNCTSIFCGRGFETNNVAAKAHVLTNCISLFNFTDWLGGSNVLTTNSWTTLPNLDSSAFLSLDWTGLFGPRAANGAMPWRPFARPSIGSALINVGTAAAGITFNGSAPDIGCYES